MFWKVPQASIKLKPPVLSAQQFARYLTYFVCFEALNSFLFLLFAENDEGTSIFVKSETHDFVKELRF
jgi:hypothetical protein